MGRPIKVKEPKVSNKAKSSQTKSLILMLVGMAAIILIFGLITNLKQKEIVIVRTKSTMLAGDVISKDMLEAYPMLERVYKELGTRKITDENGKAVTKNVFIPLASADQLVGRAVNRYIKAGEIIELDDISTGGATRNPWMSEVAADQEFYTMTFDPEDVNTRLLYPGTRIRARIVVNVQNTNLDKLKKQIDAANATETEGGKVGESLLTKPTVGGTPPPIMDSTIDGEGNYDYGTSDLTGTTPLSEIVIDSITIVDMRNSKGESIFDIYSSLLKLPVDQRIQYLSSSLTGSEDSITFQQRVTPVDVTFIVDRGGASKLAEFENSKNAIIKYTILPGVAEDAPAACVELLEQFREISNQVSSVSDKADAAKPTSGK